jgi:phage terminase large subunit GpA-like protein
MDAFTDRRVTDIVIMTSAQVGKTEVLNNIIGYLMDQDPCPIMMVQPTLKMAEAVSKDRLTPMMRDTPVLAGLVARQRDAGNTLLHKQFPGGHLTLAGANSPSSLASRPIRIVLADEVDRYPSSAGEEGDPLSLAEKRTLTFSNRKKVKVSTPTIKGASRIEKAYLGSDMRRFHVPCPHCAEMQTLVWVQVKWDDGKPETARYLCPHCGVLWSEVERLEAIKLGEWRGSAPFTGIAGFHLSELYSPWVVLADMAKGWLAAQGDPALLQPWINTSLGQTWEVDASDRADPTSLSARAEPYALGTVPEGVGLCVAAVDTQGDRLELYVWGFGEGEEAWVLDRHVFWGDPTHGVVWEQLLEQLARPLTANDGFAVPRVVAIDSGGHHTHAVYNFCRVNAMRRTPYGLQEFIAIKGQSQPDKTILGKPTSVDVNFKGNLTRNGVKLWPVGSSAGKSLLYGRFKIQTPGPGYVHFSAELPEEFYDQLTAEKLVTKYVKGFPKLEWQIDKGRRNEALDCAVYGYAAAIHLGLNKMRAADWARKRKEIQQNRSATAAVTLPPVPSAPIQALNRPRQVAPQRRGNWVTRW